MFLTEGRKGREEGSSCLCVLCDLGVEKTRIKNKKLTSSSTNAGKHRHFLFVLLSSDFVAFVCVLFFNSFYTNNLTGAVFNKIIDNKILESFLSGC